MKRLLALVVGGVLAVGIFSLAQAQFARTEDAIRYRQSVMFLIGQHFGRIAAVVQGQEASDKQAVEKNATLVAVLADLPWEAFMVPGTDRGSGLKAEAFTDPDGFKTAAGNAAGEIAKLADVAAAGDPDALKAQFGAVGQSCKACHDKFRR